MVKEKKEKTNLKQSKKIKNISKKCRTEEQETIIRFGIILGIVIICIIGIYLFTKYVVKKDSSNSSDDIQAGEINYDIAIVGNMLNKPAKDYYVFVYDGNSNNAIKYSGIIDNYSNLEDAKEVYWVDLGNELNKNHVASDTLQENTDTKDIDELVFGEFALVKVKNNQIDKIITNVDKAKSELGIND